MYYIDQFLIYRATSEEILCSIVYTPAFPRKGRIEKQEDTHSQCIIKLPSQSAEKLVLPKGLEENFLLLAKLSIVPHGNKVLPCKNGIQVYNIKQNLTFILQHQCLSLFPTLFIAPIFRTENHQL